jgi:hypothetical protein
VMSENASSIERSQTVNILRESMYRTCERYLSGAISKEEFIVQAARDQRTMVQVLAIEQLTGAARAQATALTTTAKAMGTGVTEESMALVAKARADQLAKQSAYDKLVTENKSLVPDVQCDAIPETPIAPITADNLKAKREKCALIAAAAKAYKEASSYYVDMNSALAAQRSISAEAHGTLNAAATSAQTVQQSIAQQVVLIVKENSNFNEIGMTCVTLIRSDQSKFSDAQKKIVEKCGTLFNGLAELEINSQAASQRTAEIQYFSRGLAERLWPKISTADKIDGTKLKLLIMNKGLNDDIDHDLLESMIEEGNRANLEHYVVQLTIPTVEALLKE